MAQDLNRQLPVQEIFNASLDKGVDPAVFVAGASGKDSGGTWRYLRVSASGALSNDDAANFRVSALGVTVTTSPLSADSSSISAKQGDASNLRISSFQGDAGLFRVSSIGGTSSPLSADSSSVSAIQGDASKLRISAFLPGSDITNSVEKVEQQFSFYYMSAAGIQTVKSTAGLLHNIIVNTRGTGSTLKVYDNTSAASGILIANMDTTFSLGTFDYDIKFPNGLTISTAGASQADLTISYR